MDPRPLRRLAAPRYPTKLDLLAEPGLLETLPAGWRRHEALSAAAVFAILCQSACCPATCAPPATQEVTERQAVPAAEAPPPAVAPVTRHGDGRVGFGCMAVLPPAYLSEQDAFAIIQVEASKRGLNLTPPLARLLLPKVPPSPADDASFVPDLADAEHRVSVEFVDSEDLLRFSDPELRRRLAYTVDAKVLAERVADHVRKNGEPGSYFGAFYGPVTYPSVLGASRGAAQAANADSLRAQVRDFLSWLEAQGAL